MKTYRFVGPRRIAERATASSGGTPIHSGSDVVAWTKTSRQLLDSEASVIVTFIIDEAGVLKVADRRSEHVACAGGRPVRSAGEMTFQIRGMDVSVASVSNQSTGYCPEPESWPAVADVLSKAAIPGPVGFGFACVFRRCSKCESMNVVKDGVFQCVVCGGTLPERYNCQDSEPRDR